jgi:hypothetical protein
MTVVCTSLPPEGWMSAVLNEDRGGNPFPGLRPQRGRGILFFGRENQVDAVDRLPHALLASSALGQRKSSLVNCGLRPASVAV